MGCFGWGQKVYVEKVYVLFRSPIILDSWCTIFMQHWAGFGTLTESPNPPSTISGPQKGPAERGHVEKRLKSTKSVEYLVA